MTTHDLVAAMHGCDRLALINRTIVATGSPQELVGDADAWIASVAEKIAIATITRRVRPIQVSSRSNTSGACTGMVGCRQLAGCQAR